MKDEWRKAALAGDSDVIARLLAEGSDADALDKYGQTALMLAATHGQEAVVRALLDHGANMNVTAKYGLSALMLAVINHHSAIAKQLVDAGADISLKGTGAAGFYDKMARDLAEDAGLGELATYIGKAEGAA